MNFDQARFNMIEQQIRTWNVLDQNVLALLAIVKRENFLPENQKTLAFMDTELPLAEKGRFMLSPKMEARIVQEVAVKKHENALIVGAGTGYLPALLAFHARHVTCIENSQAIYAAASKNLHNENISNVHLELGNAVNGWPEEAPFDVIVMTGSLPILPEALKKQLKPGGRLFVVLGSAPIMTAWLITRDENAADGSGFVSRSLFETNTAVDPSAEPVSAFSF